MSGSTWSAFSSAASAFFAWNRALFFEFVLFLTLVSKELKARSAERRIQRTIPVDWGRMSIYFGAAVREVDCRGKSA